MSGPVQGAFSTRGGHPPELVEAERPYLVAWGRREITAAFLATGGGCLAVLLLAAFHSPFWLLLLPPLLSAGGLSVLFFRNPRRRVPAEEGLLLAPADGRVVEVGPAEEPEYIGGPARKVAIFLSIFDVHLNRSPCGGRVEYVRHRPGLHRDARHGLAGVENESQAVGILREEPGGGPPLKVLVRQVSGAIARRIICGVSEGDQLERGRLIGMIKYGSRTELYLPAADGGQLLVQVGDRVRAGETPVYRSSLRK